MGSNSGRFVALVDGPTMAEALQTEMSVSAAVPAEMSVPAAVPAEGSAPAAAPAEGATPAVIPADRHLLLLLRKELLLLWFRQEGSVPAVLPAGATGQAASSPPPDLTPGTLVPSVKDVAASDPEDDCIEIDERQPKRQKRAKSWETYQLSWVSEYRAWIPPPKPWPIWWLCSSNTVVKYPKLRRSWGWQESATSTLLRLLPHTKMKWSNASGSCLVKEKSR